MGSKVDILKQYVNNKIKYMLSTAEKGSTKAEMALLRKGVGKELGEMPELWGSILLGMNDDLRDSINRFDEQVIYAVLTLYALHQQGNIHPMHVHEGITQEKDKDGGQNNSEQYRLGTAIANLVKKEEDEKRIRRRLNVMATSSDMTELIYHMRTIIRLLSSEGIALDYTKLTADLYNYQFDEKRNSVRLRWGEDYFRTISIMYERNEDNEDK